jgi:hypothetical protein
MANSLTGNVWKCDTAASLITTPLRVSKFVWTPAASGDDISVLDNGGNEIWTYKAIAGDTTQNIPYDFMIDGSLNGINLSTLDSGTFWVYLK